MTYLLLETAGRITLETGGGALLAESGTGLNTVTGFALRPERILHQADLPPAAASVRRGYQIPPQKFG